MADLPGRSGDPVEQIACTTHASAHERATSPDERQLGGLNETLWCLLKLEWRTIGIQGIHQRQLV